jgi:dipeptidyl-peptidase-4
LVPGGGAVTYLYAGDGSLVRRLWHHDLATGQRRVLAEPAPGTTSEADLDPAEQLRRERTRLLELGIERHGWGGSSGAPVLLVAQGGQLYVGHGGAPTSLQPMPGTDGAAGEALSPDGAWVAYSSAGDVWLAPTSGGVPRRITDDAGPGVFSGLPEYIAAEELDRHEGLWWSTDSAAVAFARVDERGVPTATVAGVPFRYPFAGGPNARVDLHVAAVSGGTPRAVDLGMAPDDYLARVIADPTGGWLVGVLPRDQRSLRWLRVLPASVAEPLWTEPGDPWLNLDELTRVLDDGRILTSSERSGFRHLELRGRDGALERVLTAGSWVVTGVACASAQRNEVLFTATRDSVLERHLYAVPLDAPAPLSDPQRLSVEPGWHEISAADGASWVDTFSDLDHSPRVTVEHRDGAASVVIHASATTAATEGFVPPELLELTAADGATTVNAGLFRAAGAARRDAGDAPPPGVVWVYGGPHSQYVKRAWEMTIEPHRQYLAQHGASVLMVDGRGTNYRGAAFEVALGGVFGAVEVADQAAAVAQVVARGEVDPRRIGITGWSYGGFMTLLCLARHPELFRVGVAGAPVTDWHGYDTAYTERYLGHPDRRPEAYAASSALSEATGIGSRLLVLHGTSDENVHFAHSQALIDRLRSAGEPAELVTLEGQHHMTRGAQASRQRLQRIAGHLLGGLGLPLPEELVADA